MRIKISFLRRYFLSKKVILLSLIVFIAIGILFLLFFKLKYQDTSEIKYSPHSTILREDGRTVFNIFTDEKYIFKSKKRNKEAVIDFLKENPPIFKDTRFLTSNFFDNSDFIREEKDINDNLLLGSNFMLNNEHYFLIQKIDGIPVYNSSVVVHLRNNNEIYSLSGVISTNKITTTKEIPNDKAIQIALDLARSENQDLDLNVVSSSEYYINEKIIGVSADTTNKIALKVKIESSGIPKKYNSALFISLNDGRLIYEESEIKDALNRNIYNCQSGSCIMERSENTATSNDQDVESLFSISGSVYNFYRNSLGRDSYDSAGGLIRGYARATTGMFFRGEQLRCPNAFWNGYELVFCNGFIVPDVVGHEFTHGVVSYTANLQYSYQSGALNESFADIIGSSIDNNWLIGENMNPSIVTPLPVPLRSISNPPSLGDPDKLSSSIYHCAASDKGGVHKNSGVFNKTFYLVAVGGSFNGCNINGIGRDRGNLIFYKALTNYLTSTSNFKDAYLAVLQSCNDLYGSSSLECQNVDRAMQATELDQQPLGSTQSPICQGGLVSVATCAGQPASSPIPTEVPPTTAPGMPANTPTPTPSLAPGETRTPTATSTPGVPTRTPTPSPTPRQFFTCERDPKCINSGKSIQLCPLICKPQ